MRFTDLPYEIQTHVFALSACVDPFSPPASLSALSRTCCDFRRLIHGTPRRPKHYVLAEVCRRRYDLQAPIRRLGALANDVCSEMLKQRCCAFRRIEAGMPYGDMVVSDLWVAYLMLLEDDGKNLRLLEHAHVEKWVRNIISSRSREELDMDGWPLETELLQLAMAILARVNTRASVAQMTSQECDSFLTSIGPFFVAGHRYPVALLPTTQHTVSQSYRLPPAHSHSFHTMASVPVYPAEELPFPHFGRRITLSRPPLAQSCIFVWYQHVQGVPMGYLSSTPANRAAAEAAGRRGATIADYEEANLVQRHGYGIEAPRASDKNGGSRRWDKEWYRLALAHRALEPGPLVDAQLRACWYRSLHEPGKFAGNWVGRALNPAFPWYQAMLRLHPATLEYVTSTLPPYQTGHVIMPMQLRLREHFITDYVEAIGCGLDDGSGVLNGWFHNQLDLSHPRGGMRLTADELVIQDPTETDPNCVTKHYKTWHPNVEFPDAKPPPAFPLAKAAVPSLDMLAEDTPTPSDVERIFDEEFGTSDEDDMDLDLDRAFIDIILTGKTDYAHGEAWGHYEVYGRVRHNDGLFVLVRAPKDPANGRWIFSGYMYGDHAIVGRWRETGLSHEAAGWEGTFVLARVPDSWPQV